MQPSNRKWLRSPSERVGTLSHADLPPPVPSPTNEEQLLVRALRARDERAFASLLDRWYSPMLRLARSYVRSVAEAEEVVQDTWLAVLAGLDRFEGRSSLKTWIFHILVNRARTRARREARTTPLSEVRGPARSGETDSVDWLFHPERVGPLAWHGRSPGADCPELRLEAEELRARIDAAIGTLPSRQQQVITLRDIEGWSAAEVCEILDLTEANQRVLLHRARLKVRDAVWSLHRAPLDSC